jgi:uncharacterized protein
VRYEGQIEAPRPREEVYSFVTTPEKLVGVLPDVESWEPKDSEHFDVKVKVGVSVMRGSMAFQFSIVEKVEGRSVHLQGRGSGMQSSVDLDMSLVLEDSAAGCRASWAADAKVAGLLASVGGRLVGTIAERYTRQITENMKKSLGGTP